MMSKYCNTRLKVLLFSNVIIIFFYFYLQISITPTIHYLLQVILVMSSGAKAFMFEIILLVFEIKYDEDYVCMYVCM